MERVDPNAFTPERGTSPAADRGTGHLEIKTPHLDHTCPLSPRRTARGTFGTFSRQQDAISIGNWPLA